MSANGNSKMPKSAYRTSYVASLIESDDFANWYGMLVTLVESPEKIKNESRYIRRIAEDLQEYIEFSGFQVGLDNLAIERAQRDEIVHGMVEDQILEDAVLLVFEHLKDPATEMEAYRRLRRIVEDFKTRWHACDVPQGSVDTDCERLEEVRSIYANGFETGYWSTATRRLGEWIPANLRIWFALRDQCFEAQIPIREVPEVDRNGLFREIDRLYRDLKRSTRRGRKTNPAADKFAREMVDFWLEFVGKSWTHNLKQEGDRSPFVELLELAGKIVDPKFNAETRAENARKSMSKPRKERRGQ